MSIVGRIVEALFKMPFKAKGKVLRGATATVHSVVPVARPADAEQDASHRFFLLEITITPAERGGGSFQLWEPGELQLVGPDAKPDDTDADGELCEIQRAEIEDGGRFIEDEGMKYSGAQRLRLLLAAEPRARQLRFRYYFELFGSVSLPLK